MFRQSHLVARNSEELGCQRDRPLRLQLTRQFCRSTAELSGRAIISNQRRAPARAHSVHWRLKGLMANRWTLPVSVRVSTARRVCARWTQVLRLMFFQGLFGAFWASAVKWGEGCDHAWGPHRVLWLTLTCLIGNHNFERVVFVEMRRCCQLLCLYYWLFFFVFLFWMFLKKAINMLIPCYDSIQVTWKEF